MSRKQKKVKAKKETVPKKYHVFKALFAGIVSALLNVLIPTLLVDQLRKGELLGTSLQGLDPVGIIEILDNIILLGPLMIALAILAALFRKGDVKRMVFDSIKGFAKIGWLMFITNMGHIEVLVSSDMFSVGLVLTGIVGIMVLFAIIKCVIAYCDYRDHREEYLDDCDAITVSKGKLPPRRKGEERPGDERIGGRYD